MFGVGLGVGRQVGCHYLELPVDWWDAMLGGVVERGDPRDVCSVRGSWAECAADADRIRPRGLGRGLAVG